MPVITRDITVRSLRRDVVHRWLAVPEHHRSILLGAFDSVKPSGPGDYELKLRLPGNIPLHLRYVFQRVEEERGGRRTHIRLESRLFNGVLRYSLRTAKPSADTLVTLHADYRPVGRLTRLLDLSLLRPRLELCFGTMLENLSRSVT